MDVDQSSGAVGEAQSITFTARIVSARRLVGQTTAYVNLTLAAVAALGLAVRRAASFNGVPGILLYHSLIGGYLAKSVN